MLLHSPYTFYNYSWGHVVVLDLGVSKSTNCRIPLFVDPLIGNRSAGKELKEKGIGYPACRAPDSNAR